MSVREVKRYRRRIAYKGVAKGFDKPIKIYHIYEDGYGCEPLSKWASWSPSEWEDEAQFRIDELPNWVEEDCQMADDIWEHFRAIIAEAAVLGYLPQPPKKED